MTRYNRVPKDSLLPMARVGIDPLGGEDFGKAIGMHKRILRI
jgi:hypothetical protein